MDSDIHHLLGVSALKLAYKGSVGYLKPDERAAIIDWLQKKNYWDLGELKAYIEDRYEIVFSSQQSYYEIFDSAGLSWKKSQKRNPKTTPELVKKKEELTEWLEAHRNEIELGELVVLFQDECHLLWGDICGYIWGKKNERVEVPIVNEKERQTYFGSLNIATGQCLIQAYPKGNGEHTIQYLKYLMSQYKDKQIALIWEGAKYHSSAEVKDFLSLVNNGLEESDWKITCLRFAPNDPTQNPLEDIWLQAKQWIRKCYHMCKTFAAVKYIFKLVTHYQIFDFAKLHTYGKFSQII